MSSIHVYCNFAIHSDHEHPSRQLYQAEFKDIFIARAEFEHYTRFSRALLAGMLACMLANVHFLLGYNLKRRTDAMKLGLAHIQALFIVIVFHPSSTVYQPIMYLHFFFVIIF